MEAIQLYPLAETPENAELIPLLAKAQALIDAQDYPAAITQLEQALACATENPVLYYNLGLVHHKTSEWHFEAKRYYDKALALDPDNPDFQYGQFFDGNIVPDLPHSRKNGEKLDKIIETNPSAEAYYNRGNYRIGWAYYAGALEDFDNAIALNPEIAEYYCLRGEVKFVLGETEGALQDYADALRLRPDYVEAYTQRGGLKNLLDDLEGALADFNRATALAPDVPEAYAQRAWLLFKKNEEAAAIQDADKALALDPENYEAYRVRGFAKYYLADKQTTQHKNKTEDPKPTAARARKEIASPIASATKELKESILKDFDKAIALAPDYGDIYYLAELCFYRADVKFLLGDKTGALADFEYAIEDLMVDSSVFYYYRGKLKKDFGDMEGARQDFGTAACMLPTEARYYNAIGALTAGIGDKKGILTNFEIVKQISPKDWA